MERGTEARPRSTRWMVLALALATACAGEPAASDTGGAVDTSSPDSGRGGAADASDAGSADAAAPDTGGDAGGGAGGDTAEGPDPGAHLYDPKHLLRIDIEMPADEWTALRTEDRDLSVLIAPKCGTAPYGSTFTWRKARVTVDGDTLDDVGIRKKGFIGSITTIKPSLKLKFDKHVDGQRLHGVERMTLNNDKQDPSHFRQCMEGLNQCRP